MKTISEYTIFCTEAQTKKALELGAPLDIYAEEYDNSNRKDNEFNIINDIVFDYGVTVCRNEYGDLVYVTGETNKGCAYYIPTAEQMREYLLKEHGIFPVVDMTNSVSFECGFVSMLKMENNAKRFVGIYPSNEEATLASIDAALEYLTKNNKKLW